MFEEETLDRDGSLRDMKNVVVTLHISFVEK